MTPRDPTSPRWILFSFEGRISRRTWWLWGVLAMLGLAAYLNVVLRVAGLSAENAELAVNALLAWPALAISVKRWHDRDKNGWWALVAFIPVIGWIWAVIANGLLAGTRGRNRFGDEPADLRAADRGLSPSAA
jgi:uncharacterized membrane protein YhaH (DUF805 family)